MGEPEGAPPRPPAVGVSLCDSAPLLWRLEDLRSVRARALVGTLLGSLPRTPRQNLRLGRPLLLLPEEERVLSEEHAAGALPARDQQGGDVELKVRQHQEEQQRSYEEQRVLALEDKKSALLRVRTASPTGPEVSLDRALQERLHAAQQNFGFPPSAMAVQLSTARAGLAHCSESRALLQADWPIRDQNPRSANRYQVFRDLRRRGFYLTSAGKFGGDFLVYPGDPLRFHAHFIAVCVSADESVCVLDILAVARLGSNVKKTVLLCSAGPDADVLYTSVQWSGMS
ncbi:tRNA-splicing endonuclease subunit Sen34 isoform X1 [Takifugu rubripes]|uniref:tRNA-splicing endonuclease subunit Sen34 n=1 Tax=Takifugu bimaculatus TaxID=433685 RepID=A0A4Z2CAV5_9TELE|nr:tRNA-splicing endonuclease subunit Sen34 isoform X1 [Takifugu rubripes]XP_056906472.1 tRNA-splicing endonuclease subunit Sen34 isoform X1 [Takifugu flavidus]XP_056906473.1 tRNA-splicing endonuclease subunit Sen34 isoform X1 [Takifugu flavidus]XP_056906474.1 tRNA-splicing endonuclease subunit Sen34 isoform X1 [Takifugu flavidus]XP_056906475.1 tRNA-splicing endonuclease subunit Sen34 isoform X1 [Takifugu flavidus]XP_056906476.1 tRNA-splicing endonuclease subunit Sen34 isoform X1 [Takifugu fla